MKRFRLPFALLAIAAALLLLAACAAPAAPGSTGGGCIHPVPPPRLRPQKPLRRRRQVTFHRMPSPIPFRLNRSRRRDGDSPADRPNRDLQGAP